MSLPAVPTRFAACRVRVDRLIDAGVGSDEIERVIDSFSVDRDTRAALWLWATAPRSSARAGDLGMPAGARLRERIAEWA